MTKYYTSNWQHGAVLDYIDIPLNNRWWLEDEFPKVAAMPSEAEKVRRLRELAAWEHPGRGSFYDDLGNIGKSPHVVPSAASRRSGPGIKAGAGRGCPGKPRCGRRRWSMRRSTPTATT